MSLAIAEGTLDCSYPTLYKCLQLAKSRIAPTVVTATAAVAANTYIEVAAGATPVTLTAPAGAAGAWFVVEYVSGEAVTLNAAGGSVIKEFSEADRNLAIRFEWDGAAWRQV